MSIAKQDEIATTGVRRPPSLVDQVTVGLTEQIVSGQYKPGELMPSVQKLAETWQVSRMVLREVLARLSSQGLINARQGRGIFVASVLPGRKLEFATHAEGDNLARIIELRMAMETEAAALAAMRRETDDLEAMRSAIERMEHGIANRDVQMGIAADVDFHRSICTATGNEHFLALFDFLSQSLYENISISRHNSASTAGRGAEAQSEHQAIFEAITESDAKRARRAARVHIGNTARRLGLSLPETDPLVAGQS